MIKSVCVFCGSNPGAHPDYLAAAGELGTRLAQAGLTLVYGGAGVGTMGQLANAALTAGGEVIGVMPRQLVQQEKALSSLVDLRMVESMHQRKALMAQLADAFVCLPGGLGTLDELAEALSWAQLGLHHNPCFLLNLRGYYDQLVAFLDHGLAQGFIAPDHRAALTVVQDCAELLRLLAEERSPGIARGQGPR